MVNSSVYQNQQNKVRQVVCLYVIHNNYNAPFRILDIMLRAASGALGH